MLLVRFDRGPSRNPQILRPKSNVGLNLTALGVHNETQQMKTLQDLGFIKNWIYEVVISCFDDNIPHAAPFGVKTPDLKRVTIEMYKGSNTLENILENKEFAINVVNGPIGFYHALFAKEKMNFGSAKRIAAPVLKDSPAVIEAGLIRAVKRERVYSVEAEVVCIHMRGSNFRLTNRAESLVLESLVLATRIPHVLERKPKELLREHYRVIRKVAPGSEYEEMMLDLLDRCGCRDNVGDLRKR